jgi:hypothetical protein
MRRIALDLQRRVKEPLTIEIRHPGSVVRDPGCVAKSCEKQSRPSISIQHSKISIR